MSINQIFKNLDKSKNYDTSYLAYGWVRTCRTSSSILGFCNINDGSNVEGLQVVISDKFMLVENISEFLKDVKTGAFIHCIGKLIESPAKGQKYEMQMENYVICGSVDDSYPLSKSKMNLDTLRNFIHLRARTNTFGSIFRIRSSLMKFLHDFYHNKDFLHLDPNVITVNECEGGAGVFQLTEKDITSPKDLKVINKTEMYDWSSDHFCRPAYLTVSSQLQLEALACGLGNVYTMNKSFRSEHSCTSKHVSEFTHLEIEMVNNTFEELMQIGEEMIKYVIDRLLIERESDLNNLNNFVSKGLLEKLNNLKSKEFIKKKYNDVIQEINEDIKKNKKLKLSKLEYGDDLGSEHENYITEKYDTGVFVTHWPIKIKSFYMKQCDDESCESFDLLIPYGIGELIGASQREENYDKLSKMMDIKGINKDDMSFYLDLRKYGSCPHGGFGLGFDRLLMLVTGIQNIKDVIPFPVYYKSCKF
jgi:asparaginyl-tRNA synthetase